MRGLIWIFRAVAFVLLLGFAIKNSGIVTLDFFFGLSWQVPLVFALLMFFALGVAVGLTAVLGSLLKQRQALSRLRESRRS